MKFMNLKRFASTALAGALALSMATPAFAANNNTTTINGSYTPITLAVTVPATGTAIINPYGLPYQVAGETVVGQQITTGVPLMIQNRSAVALKVGATLSATATTGVTLDASNASTDYDTATTKNLKVEFQAFEATGVTESTSEITAVAPQFAALEDDDAQLTGVITTTAAPATGDLVLREGNADSELQDGGAAFFRLSGKATKAAAWAEADKFTATIAFTFTPATYTRSAGTLDTPTVTTGVAGTITLTPPTGVTPKAGTIAWSSSDPAVTVTDASTTSVYKADVAASSTAANVTITVTFEDDAGVQYTATSAQFSVAS